MLYGLWNSLKYILITSIYWACKYKVCLESIRPLLIQEHITWPDTSWTALIYLYLYINIYLVIPKIWGFKLTKVRAQGHKTSKWERCDSHLGFSSPNPSITFYHLGFVFLSKLCSESHASVNDCLEMCFATYGFFKYCFTHFINLPSPYSTQDKVKRMFYAFRWDHQFHLL